MKDLQKQLRQEKKRTARLQERLQELLSSQGPQGLDALFSHHTYDDRSKQDTRWVTSIILTLTVIIIVNPTELLRLSG